MKLLVSVLVTCALIGGCVPAAGPGTSMPPRKSIRVPGGNGTSIAQAVVIRAINELDSENQIFAWLSTNYRGWQEIRRERLDARANVYRVITLRSPANEQRTLYFDITSAVDSRPATPAGRR